MVVREQDCVHGPAPGDPERAGGGHHADVGRATADQRQSNMDDVSGVPVRLHHHRHHRLRRVLAERRDSEIHVDSLDQVKSDLFVRLLLMYIYLLTYLLAYSLTHLLAYSLTYLFTYLLTYLLTHLLAYPLTYLFTYLLTCLFTYLLTYLILFLELYYLFILSSFIY